MLDVEGGILSEALQSYYDVTGIDLDLDLIDIAKSRETSVEYIHTDTTSLLERNESPFDLITCLEVLGAY